MHRPLSPAEIASTIHHGNLFLKCNSKLSGFSVQQIVGSIHVCSMQNRTHELHISIYPLNALRLSLGKTRCDMYCIRTRVFVMKC